MVGVVRGIRREGPAADLAPQVYVPAAHAARRLTRGGMDRHRRKAGRLRSRRSVQRIWWTSIGPSPVSIGLTCGQCRCDVDCRLCGGTPEECEPGERAYRATANPSMRLDSQSSTTS